MAKYIKMKKETTNSGEQQESNDELYERFNLTVDQGQEPLRIDKFLMHRIERATRNKLQQAINAGMVLVNGKEVRPNYKVKSQDEIILYSDMSPEETEVVPEKIPLNIMYEDDDLMVINKPAGIDDHNIRVVLFGLVRGINFVAFELGKQHLAVY